MVPSHLASARQGWLDGLRGFAILAVVIVHAHQPIDWSNTVIKEVLEAGQYGVQLFFVVSALTIGLTYERLSAPTAPWLVRRFFRIAPLYYYGVLLYVPLSFFLERAGHGTAPQATDVAANLLFIHTWVPSAVNNVVPGGWSIGVEIMFYLVAPLLFASLHRADIAWAAAFASIAGASLIWLFHPFDNNSYHYYWFPNQLPCFMLAIALYRTLGDRLWDEWSPSRAASATVLAGFFALSAPGLWSGTGVGWNHGLAPAAMAGAFCCLVVLSKGPWAPVVELRSLRQLGRISYSLYINHFVVLTGLRTIGYFTGVWDALPDIVSFGLILALTLAIGIPLSIVTERLIERSGVRAGHRLIAAAAAANATSQRVERL